MTNWIGDVFTSDAGWNLLETLVDIDDRMAGTEGEREAALATRDALADAGARNTRLDSFDVQGWERIDAAVHAGGNELACIALPRSPVGTVEGELVDVGYGLPEEFEEVDLEGKIAMAASNVPDWYDRFLHRREKYYHAVEAGADAFIFRNHVPGNLAPTGSIGTDDDPIGDIPSVGVSKEVGAQLGRRWDGEEISIKVDAEIGEATSQNVHADIGPKTENAVFVTSHVDAHDIGEGAWDNGAGTATIVEIANALASRADELETRVHFIAYGAEEVGLCGSSYDAEERDHDEIKAIVNNDGVGRGRTLQFYPHGFPELEAALDEVRDRFEHPIEETPRLGPHSDHWPYVRWGVPGYHVMSVTDAEGRGWGHTSADTLDKLEVRNIREQSILLTELVVRLASSDRDIDVRDADSIAEQLEAEDLAESMKITGDWPY